MNQILEEDEMHTCQVARALNQVIDLDVADQAQQTPIHCALRQVDSLYANILMDAVEVEMSCQQMKKSRRFDR